ncbi:MAG: helix-turn-helix transcriptional regulator [Candidatus Aenigmarchaeota archaeon]|nr:helix-turn-helix transcriptional regulator [Candidatus Aenigmarchaeota archaeon]
MKSNLLMHGLKLSALLLLNAKPRHGYELIKNLGVISGRRVSPGQVYPLLKQLQDSGLVQIKSRGERDKKIYSLTKVGRRAVIESVQKIGGLLDFFVRSKLTVCAHCNCEVYSGGYKISLKSKTLHFCCKNCANAYGAAG